MMQQTEKYQFNLIEPSDTFSPSPLNENMEKVEVQLDAARAEAAAGDAALEQRVQVLELHKFAYGIYLGNGTKAGDSQIIELGFTPTAVQMGMSMGLCLPEFPLRAIEIVPGGFRVTITDGLNATSANSKGIRYPYIAFC